MIIPRTRIDTAQAAPEGRLPYLQRVNQEHERIHAAIADRDADAARAAMRSHLIGSRDRLQASRLLPASRTARRRGRP
jgi:GntR family transcriptional repressor for pyruvate dehydrogenase complex